MRTLLAFIFATALTTGVAYAAIITDYSTDFTSADGFSDGVAANGIDGWVTRTGAISTTVDTDSFGAISINGNGPAMVHAGSGGTFNVGDSITLSVGAFYTGNTQNNNLRIGLRDTATGTGQPRAGVVFNMDATVDGNFDISGVAEGGSHDFGPVLDSGFDVELGQPNGETFVTTFTKLAALNTFSVDWSFRNGASSGSFTVLNSTLYGATDVYGAMQYNGPTGGETQIDSFALEYTAIPEPSTVALTGVAALALAFLRRKKS